MRIRATVLPGLILLLAIPATSLFGQGLYFGPQVGQVRQTPGLSDVEFNSDTSWLYGARLGVRILMFAVEVNYFLSSHDLEVADLFESPWNGREINTRYLGLNVKYYFPMLILQPYLTVGYGYYTAEVARIDEDTTRGFNLGAGLELQLGRKFSLLAEGKYHHVNLDIDQQEFKIGQFTIAGGFNIYF